MMLRPSQVRAATKDATHMIPDAYGLSERYANLACPVAIIGGDSDAVVDQTAHALRLHNAVPGSTLDMFAGAGHMTHYADPSRVVRAIERVSRDVKSVSRRGFRACCSSQARKKRNR
jgi:pimeloyl-ACP methyl ester carboxylesterase